MSTPAPVDPTTLALQKAGVLDTLQALMRSSGTLSLLGSVAVVVHMRRNWKNISGLPQRIILWSTLADLTMVPSALTARAVVDYPTACFIQGAFAEFSMASSILWAAVMAANVFLAVIWHVPSRRLVEYEKVYHIVVWSAAILAAVVPPYVLGSESVPYYGDAQFWCWIRREYSLMRLALSYGAAMAVIVYLLIVYPLVGYRVWCKTNQNRWENDPELYSSITTRRASNAHQSVRQRYAVKSTLYILAFVPAWSCGIANRLRSQILPTAPPLPILFLLHGALLTAQGFLNALVYFVPMLYDIVARRERSLAATPESRLTRDVPSTSTTMARAKSTATSTVTTNVVATSELSDLALQK